jgi:hypothetical protein
MHVRRPSDTDCVGSFANTVASGCAVLQRPELHAELLRRDEDASPAPTCRAPLQCALRICRPVNEADVAWVLHRHRSGTHLRENQERDGSCVPIGFSTLEEGEPNCHPCTETSRGSAWRGIGSMRQGNAGDPGGTGEVPGDFARHPGDARRQKRFSRPVRSVRVWGTCADSARSFGKIPTVRTASHPVTVKT